MARCLRCGAGNEWIEKDKPRKRKKPSPIVYCRCGLVLYDEAKTDGYCTDCGPKKPGEGKETA